MNFLLMIEGTTGSVGVVNILKIIAILLLNVLHSFIWEFDLEGSTLDLDSFITDQLGG